MSETIFRNLNANEIECRVGTINSNGLTLLLYKDARVDQNILDETFGVFGWQRKHEVINNNMFCTVSVYDKETGQWIEKQDVGVESYTEKEKGEASDSFKRACFNLGIGRELYTSPFIWVKKGSYKEVTRNGKPSTYDKFAVSYISYVENKKIIDELEIVNVGTGKVVFSNRRSGTKTSDKTKKADEAVAKYVDAETKSNDTGELQELLNKIVEQCIVLGGTQNTELMNMLKTYVPNGNPYGIKDYAVAQECWKRVNAMQVKET